MTDILAAVEDVASGLLTPLAASDVTQAVILDSVRKSAELMGKMHGTNITETEIALIARRLEERFDITMTLGTLFAEEYKPWLDSARGDIDWFYWGRYRRFLGKLGFPPQVTRGMDSITDQILDHLEDPGKPGPWARKGMVVGHVQSGKTANYTGLINKAADSGYKVIVILAGTLNSLRNQTQYRLDEGFIGTNTELKQPIGVGIIAGQKKPAYFTTNSKDFRKSIANQIGVGIGDLKEPVILVIKKNKSTLENLIDWLKNNNPHRLSEYPMLLVDDEADHASINTRKVGDEATAINRKIRELVRLFDRSSYVGYTATPFANVFIDPETESEMLGDDLFPRDFIISLDPPSNYVGPERIFSTEADLDLVREVSDYEKYLPQRHKITWRPADLPESLKEAIQVFVLSGALRLLRGHAKEHHSMMINVSRFTGVQTQVMLLVDEYVRNLRQSVLNHYGLRGGDALKNSIMRRLKDTFEKEFRASGHTWDQIQPVLKQAISPMGVMEVNSSSSAALLDYSPRNYPDGRTVIAVGGQSLSRGLTLEGLTVSYFLRNSVMYDTLMQMGRWFGFRDGYVDLCRIYMTAETASWYSHISDATNELREEFKRMKLAGMTPRDFGLCVRSHPESLIVTARNKMRSGTKVLRQVSLEGRLVETSILWKNADINAQNLTSLQALVQAAQSSGIEEPSEFGYLWHKVPADAVLEFIHHFRNHPASQLTEERPLSDYITLLNTDGISDFDVVFVSLSPANPSGNLVRVIAGLKVVSQKRKVTDYPHQGDPALALNKRRVASRGLEQAGLSESEVSRARLAFQGENIPDRIYRGVRVRPLLMLHLLDCRSDEGDPVSSGGFAAYGISFPGEAGSRRPEKLVEYVVNTTWWKNAYAEFLDEDEEDENEESMG